MNTQYLSYSEQLDSEEWNTLRKRILYRDHYKCRMCGNEHNESTQLDVHHRYYIYGHLAWEYGEDVLITLCRDCHSLIHETISPLIYLVRNGKLIRMNFTPCHRCSGAGIFIEYRHIQNGLCFRCNGAKYEELIGNSRLSLDDYLLTEEVEVDILSPDRDKGRNVALFKESKEQMSVEPSLAMFKLRTAALNGYPQAQNNLALLSDEDSKLRLLTYSAMQGVYQSQLSLSEMFADKDNNLKEQWEILGNRNKNIKMSSILEQLLACGEPQKMQLMLDELSSYEKTIIALQLGDMEEDNANKAVLRDFVSNEISLLLNRLPNNISDLQSGSTEDDSESGHNFPF